MNTVYLYDMSAIIKSGTYSGTGKEWGKPRKDYNFFSFPTGGLYSFNSWFITDYKKSKPGDIFVACFDGSFTKYLRRQRCPFYKANRSIVGFDDQVVNRADPEALNEFIQNLNYDVKDKVVRRAAAGIQLKFLRTILPKMGVNVLYSPEMEADDWIYTVCYLIGNNYKVVLRADDSDLDDCITYAPNLVKWSVSGRKQLYPEPGKNFKKIFKGEKGDNIPNLCARYDEYKLNTLMNAITSGVDRPSVLFNSQRLKDAYHLDDDCIKALQDNLYLVTPIFKQSLALNDDPLNLEQMAIYFSSLRFKNALDRIKVGLVETEEVTNLQKFSFSLLPEYVKEFYKRKEFVDETVDRTILNITCNQRENAEGYLLEAAAKYNII